MNFRSLIGVLLLSLTWTVNGSLVTRSGGHAAGENQMSDEKAIETAISEFVKAYNAGDLAGVLDYYGDDLIKIRNGGPAETKSDTAKRVAEVFARFHSRVDVVSDEIQVHGDFAFTRGSFRVTLTPKAGGESQAVDRRYLEIWRKEKGRWLVVRTMDNVE
jgi:ketosteroid isomerase-like protein